MKTLSLFPHLITIGLFLAFCVCPQTTIRAEPESSTGPATGPVRCPAFELHDQHKQLRSFHFPRPKVTLLVLADRRGSKQIDGWVRPLQSTFEDEIEIAGLADVRAVPSLMRGLVRGSFRKGVDYPVMLDWGGEVVSRFEFRSDEANLYVIDPQGMIRLHVSGRPTQARVKDLETFVRRQLATFAK